MQIRRPITNRIVQLNLALLCVCFCTPAFSNSPQIALEDIPSISGVIRTYSNEYPDNYSETRFSMSPLGMRVTDAQSEAEIIKNFGTKRVWLQDRKSRLQFEIDVEEFKAYFPELEHYLVGPETQSNVLGAVACADWYGAIKGERVWRGQIVEVWECKEAEGLFVNKQYYNKNMGLVVMVQHPDSTVEEIRDVAIREFLTSDFFPDTQYKSVSYSEFANSTKHLNLYRE